MESNRQAHAGSNREWGQKPFQLIGTYHLTDSSYRFCFCFTVFGWWFLIKHSAWSRLKIVWTVIQEVGNGARLRFGRSVHPQQKAAHGQQSDEASAESARRRRRPVDSFTSSSNDFLTARGPDHALGWAFGNEYGVCDGRCFHFRDQPWWHSEIAPGKLRRL